MDLDRIPSKRDWIVPVAIAGASLFVSAYVGYTSTDKDSAVRITAIEVQQKNDTNRLERIESKLDKTVETLIGLRRSDLQIDRKLDVIIKEVK